MRKLQRTAAVALDHFHPRRRYSNYSNVVRNPDGSRIRGEDIPLRGRYTQNTIADTPSGYVQDPTVVKLEIKPKPTKRMETQEEFNDRKRGEELISRGLMYHGTSTAEVDNLKLLVLGDLGATAEQLTEARRGLEQALLDFSKREDQCRLQALAASQQDGGEPKLLVDSGSGISSSPPPPPFPEITDDQQLVPASGGTSAPVVRIASEVASSAAAVMMSPNAVEIKDKIVTSVDTNQVRLLLSHCCRRLGDLHSAKILLEQMREVEPGSLDALRGLIELHSCMEGAASLAHFLPTLNEQELMVAYSYLSDMVISLVKDKLSSVGEGKAARFALEVLAPLRKTIGPQHFSMVVQAILENLQEDIRVAIDQKDLSVRKELIDTATLFLKAFLAREMYKMTKDPLKYHFAMLHKLFWGLRYTSRFGEALGVAEKFIQFYRKNREYLDTEPAFPHFYRETLFQYVFDRRTENVQIAKELCMELIEEFPTSDGPWRILAVVLLRNKEYDDAAIAAKKSIELCLWNKENVLVLYKIYHHANKFNVAAEVRERYIAMAMIEAEGRDDLDITSFSSDLQNLDARVQEDDLVESTGRAMREHQFRYDLAHLYSKNPDEVEARIAEKIRIAREEAEALILAGHAPRTTSTATAEQQQADKNAS